jgi:hypothetical protein
MTSKSAGESRPFFIGFYSDVRFNPRMRGMRRGRERFVY